jgi:hypothetical protein
MKTQIVTDCEVLLFYYSSLQVFLFKHLGMADQLPHPGRPSCWKKSRLIEVSTWLLVQKPRIRQVRLSYSFYPLVHSIGYPVFPFPMYMSISKGMFPYVGYWLLESTVGSFADQPSETNTCEKITKQWNWRVGLRCERLSNLFCFLSLLLCTTERKHAYKWGSRSRPTLEVRPRLGRHEKSSRRPLARTASTTRSSHARTCTATLGNKKTKHAPIYRTGQA